MNIRGLAVLVVAPIIVLPLTLGPAAADGATGSSRQADIAPPSPVSIAISSLSPVSLSPGAVLTVGGTITNTTDQDIRQLSFLTGVGNRVTSRSALSDDLEKSPGIARGLNVSTDAPLPNTLAAHTSVPFTMTIDVHTYGLDGNQATVYPFVFRASGSLGKASNTTTLGEVATYLPYFPGAVTAPLKIVWVWPLDAPPSSSLDAPDPALTASFTSDQRLRRLLDLGGLGTSPASVGGPYARVTWAIEPSLLEAAERADTSAARQWLNDLKQLTQGQNVIPLPYGDPDAVAVVRAGASTDLSDAIALGRAGISGRLPSALIQNVAWPIDGAVDQPTLDTYAAAGLSQVLISGDQVPPTDNAGSATESAPVNLETRGPPAIRGLATDPIAQKLLAGEGKNTPTPQMARQQLLALLAVAVAERPNQTPSRDLVLALPRDADPDTTWIKGLLSDTATLQWLTPVTLAETANDPVGIRTKLQPYPAGAKAVEIPTSTLTGNPDAIATLRASVANLRSMLPDDKLTRPIDQALTQAESVFWRPDRDAAGGRALVSTARTALDALQGGVRLAVADQVTLTSRDGKIPVTVENSLAVDVTVHISLSTTDPTRLISVPIESYTVAAGHKQRVLVPAKAQRSGTFKVTLVVSTPDGMQLSAVPVTVHSKAYGTITLVITFSALGVLVIALLFRARRRIKRWRSRGSGQTPVSENDTPLVPTAGSGP